MSQTAFSPFPNTMALGLEFPKLVTRKHTQTVAQALEVGMDTRKSVGVGDVGQDGELNSVEHPFL